jgi:hypothetical protein
MHGVTQMNVKSPFFKNLVDYILLIALTVIITMFFCCLTGCTTSTTLIEFDEDGKIKKKVVIESDAVEKIMEEMKHKDIAWFKNGWYAKGEVSTSSSETKTPSLILGAGKLNTGHISLQKDSKQDIEKIIKAMQSKLDTSVSPGGIELKESE